MYICIVYLFYIRYCRYYGFILWIFMKVKVYKSVISELYKFYMEIVFMEGYFLYKLFNKFFYIFEFFLVDMLRCIYDKYYVFSWGIF